MLHATSITHTFSGRTLFSGLDLEVRTGEVVAIRGPSGCGKSVLLRLLAGLDPLQSGTLTLDGKPFDHWGGPAWRAEVVWVPQGATVFEGAPEDLLARVGQLAQQQERPTRNPIALAEQMRLDPGVWTRPWAVLSGGERQRITLAIALSRSPRVLLLDEPTAALDEESTQAVEAVLAGQTAVWVTHDSAQCDRVANQVVRLG